MSLNGILQEKFPHLEVSVLKLSEVQRDNATKRIDSEFFKKEYLEVVEHIKQRDFIQLKDTDITIKHPTEIERKYVEAENGVWFFRTQNLRPLCIDAESNRVFISKADAQKLFKNLINTNDILMTRTGANYGDCAIYNISEITIASSHILIIKNLFFNQSFLSVFLNTKFGRIQINKGMYGGLQPEIAPYYLKNIYVPIIPMPFQLEIEKLVKDSHLALEQSKALYKEAEDLLYTELGLNPQNPLQSILQSHSNNINFRIATLKESFLKTGRLDSEYYQVKYEEIESFIQSYQGGFSKLEIAEIKDSNFTPKAKEKYRYIELANIGANGNISTPLEELGEDLPTRARRLVKEGDLIISSVEGSLGSCALITKEFHHCIVSTGFYVLKSHSINSETLLVLFKSSFFQHYLKKFPSGTILSAISKEELQNILIPKINPNTQDSIASHIQQSFTLRAEAKALLNEAKAKVESAIIGGGGGVNNASFVAFRIQIFRIYFPQIKAKLRDSKRAYRLGEWELLENLLGLKTLSFSKKSFDKNVESFKFSKNSHTQKLNISIQSLSQSFGVSGRLDSEYYQAKYERNETVIKSKPYARLKDIVAIKKSIEPGSGAYRESGIPFIRVSNLSPFGISQSEVFLDSKDFKKGELESLYPKANTILLSKDGSVGISYCLENDLECVTSGAILHLTIKNQALILPQYLSLVLNALPTKLQAQRDSGGSIIAHWKISEIENLLIPLLGLSIQEKIESKITQSLALRAKSKELLEKAKARVEEKISLP